MLEMGMTFSFAQAVIDNEIAAMIKRVVSGISVTDELLAVDVIKKVGIGGHFLNQRHTLNHLEKEQARPRIMDRRPRGAWEKAGAKDMYQAANQKARELLETHRPTTLPDGVAAELKRIIKNAE